MLHYHEDGLIMRLIWAKHGHVSLRALYYSVPCAAMSFGLTYMMTHSAEDLEDQGMRDLSIEDLHPPATWAITTGLLLLLIGMRVRHSLARFWEGASLLCQMRGEWFDSVDCLITFSRGAMETRRREVWEFRHTLVRLMSLCHSYGLVVMKGDDHSAYECIDVEGLDAQTLEMIVECKDKYDFDSVELILHMIKVLVTKNFDEGILQVAPPILSRVYQTLSRGLVNLLNAKKIKDVRFPLPLAQIIALLLTINLITTPLIVCASIRSQIWAPITTWMWEFVIFSMYFIAVELEMPFGDDDNDLPLEDFQTNMNSSLLMLLHEASDAVACMGSGFVHDRGFSRLEEARTKKKAEVWDKDSCTTRRTSGRPGNHLPPRSGSILALRHKWQRMSSGARSQRHTGSDGSVMTVGQTCAQSESTDQAISLQVSRDGDLGGSSPRGTARPSEEALDGDRGGSAPMNKSGRLEEPLVDGDKGGSSEVQTVASQFRSKTHAPLRASNLTSAAKAAVDDLVQATLAELDVKLKTQVVMSSGQVTAVHENTRALQRLTESVALLKESTVVAQRLVNSISAHAMMARAHEVPRGVGFAGDLDPIGGACGHHGGGGSSYANGHRGGGDGRSGGSASRVLPAVPPLRLSGGNPPGPQVPWVCAPKEGSPLDLPGEEVPYGTGDSPVAQAMCCSSTVCKGGALHARRVV